MSAVDLTQPGARDQRDAAADRVEALDHVKQMVALPNSIYVTTEMVASYFGVDIEVIRKVVVRNREEIESDGYTVLTGAPLRDIKSLSGIDSRTASLAVFPSRAVLRVGMLLRDSTVARAVRTYLLNVAIPQATAEVEVATPQEQAAHLTRRDLALMVVAEADRADAAERRLAVAQPKADAFDEWMDGEGLFHVARVADAIGTTGPRLWRWLYDQNILIPKGFRRRHPYKPYVKWFRVKVNSPQRCNGRDTMTTLVTPWGAEQIRLRAINTGLIPSALLALPGGATA